ncbi:sulfonate ABC transporter substrate-binding protein [Thermoactinomyces mirandus]|nr:sulfonate ABC transporter substrate-binding protein [Thermoactinomyces mirandus]
MRMFSVFLFIVLFAATAAGCSDKPGIDATEIRIGYQKFGIMSILKARGTLDSQLKSRGIRVKWIQFPAGPQLLEALNAGSIDIGETGNTPPIFAQAADAPLVYFGAGLPRPEAEAIVVPKDSPIHDIRQLKGKKVALNKGSNVHYLLVKALEKEGLQYKDIKPVYLPPADAKAAFIRKSVDAWVIWDPYYADAQTDLGVRTLTNAKGYTSNRSYYFAAKSYARQNQDVIKIILDELDKSADWFNKNPRQTVGLLSKQIGMDFEPVNIAIHRADYGVVPINESIIRDQQQIANTFLQIGLIPKPIDIRDVIWNKN